MDEDKVNALIDVVLTNCFYRTYWDLNVWACSGCRSSAAGPRLIVHLDQCPVRIALDLLPCEPEIVDSPGHLAYASVQRRE